MNTLDFEDLIDSAVGIYWTKKHLHNDVWMALMAVRTTLFHCGYRTNSDEYETLSFLLDIHHAKQEIRHAA